MFSSRPAVHPVEAPPMTEAVENHPPRMRLKDVQGMPGTSGGLALRLLQFAFAAMSLSVMTTTNDFTSVTAFCYLVATVSLQSLWSLSLALLDIYALLVMRCLRNSRITWLFTVGDGITSTLTFTGACASAGITVLIGNDLNICAENHCASFETATAMAFISWFAVSASFLLNFWSLASRFCTLHWQEWLLMNCLSKYMMPRALKIRSSNATLESRPTSHHTMIQSRRAAARAHARHQVRSTVASSPSIPRSVHSTQAREPAHIEQATIAIRAILGFI